MQNGSTLPNRAQRFVLPDVLASNLRVVFCGTAPGTRSARERAYYAHPGNYFWRTLHEIGLTAHRLQPAQFCEVLDYGIGLTDMAKRHYGADHELPDDAFDAIALRRKLARYKPGIVAFTSKNAARAGLGVKATLLEYGEQKESFVHSRVFILPSPSGQARGFWDIGPWRKLADTAHRL
ncbi:MAG: mismatch-specific DNA-glycosylase [Pseudomonadota bacterium]|nr:mismatch-specific DNA-glycosylase [Pseudomonadota bacterium]